MIGIALRMVGGGKGPGRRSRHRRSQMKFFGGPRGRWAANDAFNFLVPDSGGKLRWRRNGFGNVFKTNDFN